MPTHIGTFGVCPNAQANSKANPKRANFANALFVNNSRGQYLSITKNWLPLGQIKSKMATTKISVSTFGEQLRTLREQASLSLRYVASEIGIDTSLLGKIERNERPATKEQIKQVAIFFKVNEKQLLKETVSDMIAYKIIEEEVDIDTLKVAERKVEYLKTTAKTK